MPVTGRKSKPEGQAVNRHKPTYDWVEVENIPFGGGPKLPPRRSNGRTWDARIKKKWDVWRTMPHCALWTTADWDFALDAIEVAALFYETGQNNYVSELRAREKILGTTMDFLRDLRIRYVEPKQQNVGDADAGVTNIADYRDF